MRRAIALVLLAVALTAGTAHGQGVGSWRNSPPGSKAIHYDAKGRRIYWDANGFVVGHYDFRTRRYVSLIEAQAAKEASKAGTTSSRTSTVPRRRWYNPHRLAIVYRGGGRGYGRAASSAASGPKVIITGNFPTGNIVRHERHPPPEPNVAQAAAEFTTSNMP